MTGGRNGSSPDLGVELETSLRAARSRVEFPPTPDIWPAIAPELLITRRPTRMRQSLPRRPSWPLPIRVLATSALVLALMALALLAFPELRTAVAERLGLSGVVIRFIDEPPTVTPAGSTLNLGQSVTLDEAQQAVGFPLLVPAGSGLDRPDSVYVTIGPANPMVSLVYPASELLPASRYSGIGALITQFEAVVKGPMIAKGVMPDSTLRSTSVGGAPGYWVEGGAHVFVYQTPAGEFETDESRLAGNVLLWEVDGITYRLESELTEDAAIAVAESMRPIAAEDMGTDRPAARYHQ